MNINRNYITTNPNNTGNRGRKGTKADYLHIALHYTGAIDKSRPGYQQTAKNNCIYYRDYNPGASAHFYLDNGTEVYQSVPWDSDRTAWHIGIGSNNKKDHYSLDPNGIEINNGNTIGVEICPCKINPNSTSANDDDWYFDPVTYQNAVNFVKYLMDFFNIPIENVYRHYDCNTIHKVCPSMFVGKQVKKYYQLTGDQLWAKFLLDLQSPVDPVVEHLQPYVVNSSDGTLNLRLEPSNGGKLIYTMKTGDFVLGMRDTTSGWVYVKYVANNKVYQGWCYGKYLSAAKGLETRTVKSPDGTLNIRALPNTKGSKIAQMGNGFNYVVLQRGTGSWGFIQCGETIGYCNISDNYSKKM